MERRNSRAVAYSIVIHLLDTQVADKETNRSANERDSWALTIDDTTPDRGEDRYSHCGWINQGLKDI